MTSTHRGWTSWVIAAVASLSLCATPALAQHHGGGGGGGGHASGGGGGSHSGGGGGSHSSGGGGGTATTRATSSGTSSGATSSVAVPRGSASTTTTTNNGVGGNHSQNGRPTIGTATPRSAIIGPGGGSTIFVPGGYYGFGYYSPFALGLGYYGYNSFYGGYYDPWYGGYPAYGGYPGYGYGYPNYDPYGYGGYQAPPSAPAPVGEGTLRLKVRPRDAQVYVDGNYVGIVDDFSGLFHHLHLDSGPHHVEIRADGYQSLTFDINILTNQTTTYQGELRRQ